MGIEKVEIQNYKSLKKCSFNLEQINLFIGENGCGKTNILNAIKYFMDNLNSDEEINECGNIYDINNPFNNCIKISVYFNLDKFQKIASNQLLNIPFKTESRKYSTYYKKIIKLSYSEMLKVTLTKVKDKRIRWDLSRENRKILSSLFPVYYLDSRRIDLFDWSELWNSIGDLMKIDNDVYKGIRDTINKFLEGCDDPKFISALSNIKSVLINSIVQVHQFTPKEYSSALTKTYLQGDKFEYNTRNLSFCSNGTNSYNYTVFLFDILELISRSKLKSPTILLDEPELSLHHMLVDRLSNRIFEGRNFIKSIISTHSPRLVKNVLQEATDKEVIYNIKMSKEYTSIYKMKLFDDKTGKEKSFITDEHANAYFSKILLCVEGESDVSFFKNKYLKDLYPIIEIVDIYKTMSNNVVANIILPERRRYNTPAIILLDMDKVLCFDNDNARLKLKGAFTQSKNSYKFLLSYKRMQLNHLYRRILGIVNKSTLHFDDKWGYCKDAYFMELLALIKEYFLGQSTFINNTTLEGMIVNKENHECFKDFFLSRIKQPLVVDFNSLYNSFNDKIEKCNFLRLLCNGKADIILNTKELSKLSTDEKGKIESIRFQKTDGWMSEFIEYYIKVFFEKQGHRCENFSQYKAIIKKNPDLKSSLKREFEADFHELNSLMALIEKVNTDII